MSVPRRGTPVASNGVRRAAATKPARQAAILELVRSRPIRTQEELVDALAGRHLDVTQATVSRDIRELGLHRVAGAAGVRYLPGGGGGVPESAAIGSRLRSLMRDHVRSVEFVGTVGVLRGRPSTAPLIAAALDAASLGEMAGTVAGDDTVIVVARGRDAARRLERQFREMIGER